MKISELNNKAFLGSAGAAENSYVLINYEDSETDAPVTYKATLQELGRAIVNDQQLYKKTQNGAVTTTTNNGAYVNGTAENFASVGAINSAVNGLASTGYVTNAINQRHSQPNETKVANNYLKYYTSTDVLNYITLNMISGANEYVTSAIGDYAHTNQLATTSYVDSMVEGLTSTGDISDTIDNLKSQIVDYSGHGSGDIGETLYELYNNNGNASIGYVDDAISGLASTGYVTNAVANAGGGGFNPTTPVACSVISENVTSQENLYPAMIVNDSGIQLYIQSSTSVGKFIYGGKIASVSNLDGIACVSTSDNRPCIRDYNDVFVGFLSTT